MSSSTESAAEPRLLCVAWNIATPSGSKFGLAGEEGGDELLHRAPRGARDALTGSR
jgi:hypothetical protein